VHFRQLATPEQHAERQRQLNEGINERETAKLEFQAALSGPIDEAKDKLTTVFGRPGFRQEWVDDELSAALTKKDISRVAKLSTCPLMKHNGRIPLVELIHRMILKRIDPTESIVQQALDNPLVTEDSLETNILTDTMYKHEDIRMVEMVMRKGKVTKEVLHAAKFLCKAPENVATPERLAILRLVEMVFKEQTESHKKRALPSNDDSTKEKENKRTRIDEPLKCQMLRTIFLDETERAGSGKYEIWTCGAYLIKEGVTHDHRDHDPQVWGDQFRACDLVTEKIQSWEDRPDGMDFGGCFFFTKKVLRIYNANQNTPVEQVSAMMDIPFEHGETKDSAGLGIIVEAKDDQSKVFFNKRICGGFEGNKVDPEIFKALEEITEAFKAAVRPGTTKQIIMYDSDSERYVHTIFLVGEAAKLDGGLVMLVYADYGQEHLYHGTFDEE